MGNNVGQINWVFHNASSQAGDGNILNIHGGMNTLAIEITGSEDAAGDINFLGKAVDDGLWYRISCANKTTLDLSHTTSVIGGLWEMDLTGLTQVKVFVSPSAGTITVKGRCVN